MSRLIVLRGNSGSGKTTVARALQAHFGHGTLLISQDVVRRDMLKVKDGANTPALPLLMELLRYGSRHSEVTVLEGILRAEWYAPLFEAARREFGGNIFAYYWDIPFAETLRRHATKPNRAEFGEPELRDWWLENDYAPALLERRLGPELSLEETVSMILRETEAPRPVENWKEHTQMR